MRVWCVVDCFRTDNDVYSSPMVFNGVVYFGSNDNNLYAANSTTGAQLWSFTACTNDIWSSPALSPDNSLLYFGSNDNNVRSGISAGPGR